MSGPCLACINDKALGYKSPLPFCGLCGAPRTEAKENP